MCELTAILEGEKVFESVVYVKASEGKVLLRDVLGESKEFSNCYVEEVNIGKELLVLKRGYPLYWDWFKEEKSPNRHIPIKLVQREKVEPRFFLTEKVRCSY